MQDLIFRHNIAIQNIAFFRKRLIHPFCIHAQPRGDIFNTKYSKLQFPGIFYILILHHERPFPANCKILL